MFKAKFSSSDDGFDVDFNETTVTKGEDGFSPIIEVEKTSDGHLVTVTDAEGTQSFKVKNGEKGEKGDTGENGKDGPIGPQGNPGNTPIKGVDYFTVQDKEELCTEIESRITNSDWNAKEGQAGYIKNRTHYVETKEYRDITLVYDATNSMCLGEIDANFAFSVGANYTIIWNGAEYNCTGYLFRDQFAAVGDGTNEPFVLVAMGGMIGDFLSQDTNGAVVTIIGEIVVPLADKFMPNTVPLMVGGKVPASQLESDVFYVNFFKSTDGEYTCSATKQEILIANNAGKLVVGRLETAGGFYNLLLHGASGLFLSFSGYVCDYLVDTDGYDVLVQYDGTTVNVYKKKPQYLT